MEQFSGTHYTVLVVDDNPSVLKVVVAILEQSGFQVLPTHSAAEAIKVATESAVPIHLLISDVDMPLMPGPELSKKLKILWPDMRVLLMSGGDNGLLVMNYGWSYLQKPFLSEGLLQMVSDVLNGTDRSQQSDQFDIRMDAGAKERNQ